MNISKELRSFLGEKSIQHLLRLEDYKELYKQIANDYSLSIVDLGTFTTLLYNIGKNPLKDFNYIPGNFFYHSDLEYFNIPENIIQIRESAFSQCENLKSIKISDGVEEIFSWAFYGCINLTNIKLPNSIRKVGSEAFTDCKSLISVNIPSTIDLLGSDVFKNCYNLQHINYIGTKEQWEELIEYREFFPKEARVTIHCTDGNINY